MIENKEKYQQQILFDDVDTTDEKIKENTPQIIVNEQDWVSDEKIEKVDLDEKEKKEFIHSIDAVKALWEAASKIDSDLSK